MHLEPGCNVFSCSLGVELGLLLFMNIPGGVCAAQCVCGGACGCPPGP